MSSSLPLLAIYQIEGGISEKTGFPNVNILLFQTL